MDFIKFLSYGAVVKYSIKSNSYGEDTRIGVCLSEITEKPLDPESRINIIGTYGTPFYKTDIRVDELCSSNRSLYAITGWGLKSLRISEILDIIEILPRYTAQEIHAAVICAALGNISVGNADEILSNAMRRYDAEQEIAIHNREMMKAPATVSSITPAIPVPVATSDVDEIEVIKSIIDRMISKFNDITEVAKTVEDYKDIADKAMKEFGYASVTYALRGLKTKARRLELLADYEALQNTYNTCVAKFVVNAAPAEPEVAPPAPAPEPESTTQIKSADFILDLQTKSISEISTIYRLGPSRAKSEKSIIGLLASRGYNPGKTIVKINEQRKKRNLESICVCEEVK